MHGQMLQWASTTGHAPDHQESEMLQSPTTAPEKRNCPVINPALVANPCLVLAAALMISSPVHADEHAPPPSPAVQEALELIRGGKHPSNTPYILLDKQAARLWVFDPNGGNLGSTPVLVGSAVGDESVPGIGSRPLNAIKPHERTTPAGRFRLEPGKNLKGDDIFWVDYDAAVSLHRMRQHHSSERRQERMSSPTPADNRISYGCINVPPAFYNAVIHPAFSSGNGWIYVLPETRPVNTIFR